MARNDAVDGEARVASHAIRALALAVTLATTPACTLLLPYPPPPNSCDAPSIVVGEEGVPAAIEFDTRLGTTSATIFCASAVERAPQFVVTYTVPGVGLREVLVSTENATTPASFDTVIVVRRGPCEADTSEHDTCFDDSADSDPRASGHFLAQGGETLNLIVAGYHARDRGPGELVIETRATHAPHLTMATVASLADTSLLVTMTASDEDGDLTQAELTLYTMDGALVDVNGDGVSDPVSDALLASLDPPPTGTESVTAVGRIVAGMRVLPSGAIAHVRALDALGNLSAETIEAASTPAEIVGVGETCGGPRVCDDGLACTSGACTVSAGWSMACATAQAVTLDPTNATDLVGTLPPDHAALTTFECMTHTRGPEAVLDLTLPAGHFDLLATTEAAGTGDTDTVLYALRDCTDPVSFLGCNDDVVMSHGMPTVSSLTILDAPHALTMVVDTFATGATAQPYELILSLRPVLDPGAACDWMEHRDRCATGHCSAAINTCP